MEWQLWFLPFFGYLVGSFPTGVVLSRKRFGIDVRETGSGNIGATNVTRTFGWKAGVLTFGIDFAKGYLVSWLAQGWCDTCPWAVPLAGFAVVLGHCHSAFLSLRGGKGVATAVGSWTAVVPWVGVLMALAYALGLGLTGISAVGSLVAIAAVSVAAALFPLSVEDRVLVWAVSALVLLRHHRNLRRLATGRGR